MSTLIYIHINIKRKNKYIFMYMYLILSYAWLSAYGDSYIYRYLHKVLMSCSGKCSSLARLGQASP